VQHQRELQLLEQAEVDAELVLQLAGDGLDVDRETVKGTTVGRDPKLRDLQTAGDQRRPREIGVEHRPARHAVGERVPDRDQSMGGMVGDDGHVDAGHAWADGDAERRVGDRWRGGIGDDDVRRGLGIEVLRGQVSHGSLPVLCERFLQELAGLGDGLGCGRDGQRH